MMQSDLPDDRDQNIIRELDENPAEIEFHQVIGLSLHLIFSIKSFKLTFEFKGRASLQCKHSYAI